ncbi:hypothetical protein HMI54_008927, partial [Coelomomyces lativittatus]
MSFFKHGEAWLKDALNKVENQLDKAFEIPKETSTSASSINRTVKLDDESIISDTDLRKNLLAQKTISHSDVNVEKNSSLDLELNGDIKVSSFQAISSSKDSLKKSSSLNHIMPNTGLISSNIASRSESIDPANIPLPPDSPPLSKQESTFFKDATRKSPIPENAHQIDKNILLVVSAKDEQICSLLKENERIQFDLSRSRETIKKLLAKVQTLENKIREYTKSSREPSILKQEDFKALEVELEHWKTLAREVERKNQNESIPNIETDSYRLALEAEVKKSFDLQNLLKNLKEELNVCRSQLDQSQAYISTKETEFHGIEAQLHTELDRYRSQFLEMQKKFDETFQKTTLALTTQLQQAELSLKSIDEAHHLCEEKLASQLTKSKNDGKQLESQLESLRSEHLHQLKLYQALESKHNDLLKIHEKLLNENEKQKETLESLEFENLSKDSSDDLIAAASQTDISALAGSNNSIFLAIAEPMRNSLSETDSNFSKESSQLSFDRLQTSNSSVLSRKLSSDLSQSSIYLAGNLKTQLSVLQTSKEQLTLQVVQLTSENTLLY